MDKRPSFVDGHQTNFDYDKCRMNVDWDVERTSITTDVKQKPMGIGRTSITTVNNATTDDTTDVTLQNVPRR